MTSERFGSGGIHLLKKGQKGLLHLIFSRMGIVILLFLVQLSFMFGVFIWFQRYIPHVVGGVSLLSLLMVIYVINRDMDPTAKITWLVIIMVVPVFGSLLYVYTRTNWGNRATIARLKQISELTAQAIVPSPAGNLLEEESPATASLARYIRRTGCYPVYDNTAVTYYALGDDLFEPLLRELERAEHFIFIEYFIISEGLMWGKVLEILARKAAAGVEVRVMYDGTCEFSTLPHDYPQRLQKLGISCKMFAPIKPFVSTHYNYRDHRKILVIDGHTAFTGGVNLADEYINQVHRFGRWKDTALMLKGDGVKSFTLMFLQLWHMNERSMDFQPWLSYPTFPPDDAGGYVIPYGDCPLDNERVGEMVYMDLLNQAVRYVHIMSPYLILDSEMETALKFAAERGVEVCLILPHTPDKRIPFALAKTHFRTLMESGVKLYEYLPGFIHAKSFVCDGKKAVVGTINLDYRSLYHHFECAAYLYETPCIADIEADFQSTLLECRLVTRQDLSHESLGWRLAGKVLKLIAPLL